MRRRYFRENSGPDDVFDCGIQGVGVGTTAHVDFEVFSILSEEIDGSRVDVEGRKGSRTENERGEVGNERKFGGGNGWPWRKNMVEDFKRVRWADLEDEEQGSRCEKMVEKEETVNKSEALAETQIAGRTGGQRRRDRTTDGKRRQQDEARRSATAREYDAG